MPTALPPNMDASELPADVSVSETDNKIVISGLNISAEVAEMEGNAIRTSTGHITRIVEYETGSQYSRFETDSGKSLAIKSANGSEIGYVADESGFRGELLEMSVATSS